MADWVDGNGELKRFVVCVAMDSDIYNLRYLLMA